jgi:hypothetical protein
MLYRRFDTLNHTVSGYCLQQCGVNEMLKHFPSGYVLRNLFRSWLSDQEMKEFKGLVMDCL